MAQTTNYEIANSSGLIFRGRVNEVFAAVQSSNSGATEPTGTVAYQLWYDTTTNILKMRNASNSTWISLFTVDQTNGVWSVDANSTSNALRITQTGTGNALLVEDSANPDSTPFVITGAGDVGIGISTPSTALEVVGQASFGDGTAAAPSITNTGNLNTGILFPLADTVAVSTGGIERARIISSGHFLIGTTVTDPVASNIEGFAYTPSVGSLRVNADANFAIFGRRQDGTIMSFCSAGTSEGTINISGTTTSYNGGHLSRWAQFPDNSRPEILKGTIMSNLDQMSNWGNEENEQLNCVQVSAVEGDPNVAGVFVAWDNTDDGYNDIFLAMTGDMVIRIGAGVTVARGDLLMSAGDGTAKPQGDDIVRSKTIAKVTSTHVSHTYADGSYAVPCVLMAC